MKMLEAFNSNNRPRKIKLKLRPDQIIKKNHKTSNDKPSDPSVELIILQRQ